ncbi:MAG: hypothetical protein H6648_10075 [Caldilineae bacterium]|nr:hypothetical protein [Caldilineae bacterium]
MPPHVSMPVPTRMLRLAFGIALGLALFATLRDLRPTDAAAGGPLEAGRWESMANGDRIARLLREGDEVWAATDGGGVLRWSLAEPGRRQYLAPQDGLRSNIVNDLARDASGTLWAATSRGLARLDPDSDRWQTLDPDSSPGMPSRRVTALLADPGGDLWIGFEQEWSPSLPHPRTGAAGAFAPGGLARFRPDENRWVETYQTTIITDLQGSRYASLPSDNITRLARGSDGILWIGTRPYFVWDRSACGDECGPEAGAWINSGGGLAAFKDGEWSRWMAADTSASCYPSHVTDLAPDVEGRVWVGTIGRGLLLIRSGMTVRGCNSGLAYYSRPRRSGIDGGLRGNTAWSVDVAPDGRVWIGTGEGSRIGQGIAVLDHRGTFTDSSACETCPSDDRWEYIDVDGLAGESDTLVTALVIAEDGAALIGTQDNRNGDGEGIRLYSPDSGGWQSLRFADGGLPSNHISAAAVNPISGDLWLSFKGRGAARFDGTRWQGWRMFGAGPKVAGVTLGSRAGFALLQVDIPDRATFDARFPVQPASVRIAGHPIVYTVKRFKDPAGNTPAYLELTPPLIQPVQIGDPVQLVDRGPASDSATQIGFTPDGAVWIGGRETIWLGENCPSSDRAKAECWLDGGISRFDGSHWRNYDQANSQVPDQEVQAVTVDRDGRVWVGTGDGGAEGDGIGVLDPASGTWTLYDRGTMPSDNRMGSNGISDFSIDPQTGDIWTGHHAVVQFQQNLGGGFDRRYVGGGVSRWNGQRWETWSKPAAPLAAFGVGGDIGAVLADRRNGRIWAGSWTGDDNFHWLLGFGINAALNWCPIDRCTNTEWQSKIWPGDGKVAALAADADGNVWAGTHREGVGIVPPVAGIKLYDGSDWFTVTDENSQLPFREITALAPDGDAMWVGALNAGLARWAPAAPPTATPSPRPRTATPRPSLEPSPTARSSNTPRPSATPPGACRPGLPCRLHLPLLAKQACLRCAPATPTPGRPSATPLRASATPGSTVGPSSTPRPSPTPSPTERSSATPTRIATGVTTPSSTPSRSATASATASPSASPSPTPTPIVGLAPIGTWTVYDPGPLARLPRKTLYDVQGTAPDNVWIVGADGTALFWDGTELIQETLPAQETLRAVQMLPNRRGFIVGDNGTVLEMRSGRWIRSNTNAVTDDWQGVSVIDTPDGLRGWLVGSGRGNRLFYDGSSWNTTGPDDRNTSHVYSGVAMLDPLHAVSIQSTGGGRLYDWTGERWWPGASVGPMRDIHVPGPGLGVMGGDNGSVYTLAESGSWSPMADKPVTRGTPIFSVHMLARDRIYASAGQTSLFAWDGTAWQTQRITGVAREVQGVWVSADGTEGWAVGTDGLLLRYQAP